ncbi:MAG: rhomboid family intramembrane serine protease [Gammaproteobacteria bacterium]|nr:rhomboid family intramembrane serine protease [Gammaproteobacteria bacterium]
MTAGAAPTPTGLVTSVVGGFLGICWALMLVDHLTDFNLPRYGNRPQELAGLFGILVGPLIHGSFTHLLQNTPPIAVLGTAIVAGYPLARWRALGVIYFGSGLAVWCLARPSSHIGASGLALGMMTFVFVAGVMRWDRKAIALALIVAFLFGGMIWGIFPSAPGVSYESHFFGAVMGVVAALLFGRVDPTPPPKRYSWEFEEAESSVSSWKPTYGPTNRRPGEDR